MVDLVNAPPSRIRAALPSALVLAALFASAAAGAAVLRDPMRPPSMGSMASSWSERAPVPSGPRLQAIHFSTRGRTATIDGRRVRVGDSVGTARVAAITRSTVVLRDGSASRTLQLFPDFGKRVLTPASHSKY